MYRRQLPRHPKTAARRTQHSVRLLTAGVKAASGRGLLGSVCSRVRCVRTTHEVSGPCAGTTARPTRWRHRRARGVCWGDKARRLLLVAHK
jgi:hypothetical protein